jgi:hypothetical protein
MYLYVYVCFFTCVFIHMCVFPKIITLKTFGKAAEMNILKMCIYCYLCAHIYLYIGLYVQICIYVCIYECVWNFKNNYVKNISKAIKMV